MFGPRQLSSDTRHDGDGSQMDVVVERSGGVETTRRGKRGKEWKRKMCKRETEGGNGWTVALETARACLLESPYARTRAETRRSSSAISPSTRAVGRAMR